MTWEELLAYCLAKPGAWQDEPYTLRAGGVIPDDEVTEAIDASYEAVLRELPAKDRPAG